MNRYVYKVEFGCTRCGTCVVLCPTEAITLDAQGAHIDQSTCKGCGICYDNCASEAISKRPNQSATTGDAQ